VNSVFDTMTMSIGVRSMRAIEMAVFRRDVRMHCAVRIHVVVCGVDMRREREHERQRNQNSTQNHGAAPAMRMKLINSGAAP